jgi:ABC-type uncharacterized transport system permease subunit
MALHTGWLRPVPIGIVLMGLMTAAPTQALTGALSGGALVTAPGATAVLLVASCLLFRLGQCCHTSASS